MENFRPGVMEKWGLAPEARAAGIGLSMPKSHEVEHCTQHVHCMQDLPPELVYVRISGYGQTGPKAPLAGGRCLLGTYAVCLLTRSFFHRHADNLVMLWLPQAMRACARYADSFCVTAIHLCSHGVALALGRASYPVHGSARDGARGVAGVRRDTAPERLPGQGARARQHQSGRQPGRAARRVWRGHGPPAPAARRPRRGWPGKRSDSECRVHARGLGPRRSEHVVHAQVCWLCMRL